MSPEARDHSFDELTRGLANDTLSRGKALRLMGAALVGGTLASLPGVAWAAKGGRSSCAHFCQSLFGASTPQEGECVSQAKSREGACFRCTEAGGCGPSFTKPTCPEVTGQTYNCSTCQCECPTGQEECGGKCGTSIGGTCTTNDQCCSGNCSSGTCAAACKPNFTEESTCLADSECCSNACVHTDPTDPTSGGCLPCHCPNETSGCFCRNRGDVTGSVCIDFSQNVPLPFTVVSCADCPADRVCFFRAAGGGMLVLACGYTC